ncbi:MAG: galactose mutarotase [Spirochaetales bacterium]|nr:galactose mutarotase [Spirochaetales bacterium]
MNIEGKTYGTTKAGDRIDSVTITNNNGISITAISYGAMLISVKTPDKNGISEEITLGKKDLEAYEAGHPFFGATIGRFANRISGGSFSLNNNDYTLPLNDDPNCLHGGSEGFDKQVWDIFPFKSEKEAGVKFSYISFDNEQGFPGKVEITSTYILTEKNELFFNYEAITDKDTPINITNHTYWNLSGGKKDNILSHDLELNCKSYLPVDEVLIPTGEIKNVSDTPFDFSVMKKIGKEINNVDGGYDHCWVTSNFSDSYSANGNENLVNNLKESAPSAIAIEEDSGRKLELFTTLPGIQFYAGNGLENETGRDSVYKKHGAFCLETQNFPDSPNKDNFPSPILKPGEKYIHSTMIRFSTI